MDEDDDKVNWTIWVPLSLDILLEQAVKKDTHSNKSELVRQAVRDKIDFMQRTNKIPKLSYDDIDRLKKERLEQRANDKKVVKESFASPDKKT